MENFKIKMTLKNYIYTVIGRPYSPIQKVRLLRLISMANGLDNEEIDNVINVFKEIDEEEFSNFAFCNNYLLYSILSENESPIKIDAISILYDIAKAKMHEEYSSQTKKIPSYYNERVWLSTIQKEKNYLEMGYYKYAKGKLAEAIEAFEKVSKDEINEPIDEYIAIISQEANDYAKAYEYALKAQFIDGEKIEIDWLMEIEELAKAELGEKEAKDIMNKITNKNKTMKIGFGNI